MTLNHDVQASLRRLARLLNASRDREALGTLDAVALADWIYAHWYTVPSRPFGSGGVPRQPLPVWLRAALEDPRYWQPGWVALEVAPGQRVMAGRGLERLLLAPGDFANLARPGVPVAPGDGLVVWSLLQWIDAPTGFFGLRHSRAEPARPLVRVYLSVGLPAMATVLPEVVGTLEDLGRPWCLKCPSEAAGFLRVDALVVYVQRADWPAMRDTLAALAQRLSAQLRRATPPLTGSLGRGMAWAEDPSVSQSFGQSRCLALARGLVERFASSRSGVRYEDLVAALSTQGINPAEPWKGPA